MSETTAQNIRIAINGFGRIGRAAFKIALAKENLDIVAINDLSTPEILAHMLKYDTAYGVYPHTVQVEEEGADSYLVVDQEEKALVLSEKEPARLPWGDLNIDVVLECTGQFTKDDTAALHIKGGARKVVVSAPTKGGVTRIYMLGVNHDEYSDDKVISNASCTTNCISPVVSVMHNEFEILKSLMTTVHGVTASQSLVDSAPNPKKPDLRRARAAPWNIIPTTTGAAKATTKAIPDLEGKFDGLAMRVPVITGSISDITMLLGRETTVEEVNEVILSATENEFYKGVLGATQDPIVSSDIVGNSYSALVDLNMTRVVGGDMVKVLAWYDNEWGYSTRLVDMAVLAATS